MKSFIKHLFAYDKIYPILKSSFLYHSRKKLQGQIANIMYGYPSKDFFVIGITGTNGKTTTANLLHKIVNENLGKSILISTANIKIGNKEIKNTKKMTSLDIYDLQSTLAIAKDSGCKIAILEVSSHGLDQYRFEGVKFDGGILTNITHDHLDYHKTMEEYAKAKKRLFTYIIHNGKNTKYGVFPLDDPYGKKRHEELAIDKKCSYSIAMSAVLKAENIQTSAQGTQADIIYMGKRYPISTPLPGTFNISNILAAVGMATEIGISIEKALSSIQDFQGVEGRMEKYEHKNITYYVDFAHTPDALEKVLIHLQEIKGNGKVWIVAGATGCRDKEKRPIMGEIIQEYADTVILTDDDPDTENRLKIIQQLSSHINKKTLGKDLFLLPERKLAIRFACTHAQAGDIVICTGKGHESVQYTNFGKRPWSDMKEIIAAATSPK